MANSSIEIFSSIKTLYNEEILSKLFSHNGAYIDDHRSSEVINRATHVARFIKDSEEHIVLLPVKEYFCLKPIELGDDGVPHLSCRIVGGTIIIPTNGTFEKAIEIYNAESKAYPWDSGRITEIIAI